MSNPRGTDFPPLPVEAPNLDLEPAFESTFRVFFQERFGMLYRYLHRLSGDRALADDIAQESFVRLYQRGSMPDDAPAWLVSVANNLMRDERRKVVRRQRLLVLRGAEAEEERRPPGADAQLLAHERAAAVREALGTLNLRDRQILVLRHEGYSYREIAGALGLAATSIGTLLIRATAAFSNAFRALPHASD